jgi:branched-chain amino acid transport system substrate-binding protein
MSQTSKLKGFAILLALFAALMLGLAACGGDDEEGAEAPPAAEGGDTGEGGGGGGSGLEEGTYKIGFVESITGRLAFYDPVFAQGMKLAIDQINEEGGVDGVLQIEMIERDGKSDPAQGAVVARELIAEGVQFAVTPCDADIGIPGAQLFQQEGIPVVMACGSGWTFPKIVGDFAFNNVFGTAAMGAAQAEWAMDQGYERACDLSSNDYFYGKNTSDIFQARYKELGGEIACHVFYKLTDSDFRAVATQIAQANPDIVTTTLVFPGSTTFLKQVRAQGYDGPFIWSDSIDSQAAVAAGSALNNVFFTTHACPEDESTRAFFDEFEARYGEAPDANFVATGGDLVLQIEAALLAAGTSDPQAVRDAYANLENVEGISGSISYKDAPLPGNPIKDVHVLEWKDGTPTCVESFYPEEVPAIE